MKSPELPYDVLKSIFKELASPVDDIESELAYWLVFSASAALRSCSLVSRAWRLPAQQTLWMSIRLEAPQSTALFLRTAAVRPDLPRQSRLLTFNPCLEDDDGLVADDKGLIHSTLFLAALIACTNVRTLITWKIDDSARPGLERAIASMQHLEAWCGDTTLRTAITLLNGTPSLRALELCDPQQWEMSPLPPLSSSPAHLTTLVLMAGPAIPVLELIKAVGPTLRQLSVTFQGLIPPQDGLASFAATTSSLRHLRLSLPTTGASARETEWFENLLPTFSRLERLLVSPSLVSEAKLLSKLPPTLRWMELSADGEPTIGMLKALSTSLPPGDIPLPLRELYVTHYSSPFSPEEASGAVIAFRAKGVVVKVHRDQWDTLNVFDTSW